MKIDKRKQMEDASEAWVMENPENRTIFCVIGDKESDSTSCGVHGREDLFQPIPSGHKRSNSERMSRRRNNSTTRSNLRTSV